MGFEYHRPETIEQALALAARLEEARFVAGGTDLLVGMGTGRPMPATVISLRGIAELAEITSGDRVRIGAGTPLTDIAAHPVVRSSFPALVESIAVLGGPQIRNMATLGGNLCNASPAADTAPALLVHAATIEVIGADGAREVPVAEFFLGPGRSCLEPGEIVVAVNLEPPAPGTKAAFLRKGRVRMDLAIASVAALAVVDDGTLIGLRLAAGAVAPTPLRLTHAEALLEGLPLTTERRASALDAARSEISPITDLRATADYRRHLTGVLLDRALGLIGGGGL